MGREWQPISDYTVEPADLAQDELRILESVWQEQRDRLAGRDAFQRFNERLKREWAIETGLIERLYVLDRGITQLLIDRGIDASLIPHGAVKNPELVVSMINDHEAVVDGIFEFVIGKRPLSTSYIKEMHQLITRHQYEVEGVDALGRKTTAPLISGDYKRQPNNPLRADGDTHEYCPPEQVASEMDKLIELHLQHVEVSVPAEVEAAWLHHRFTQIHPFQDGNGRVARALATLIFVKKGWFPLVVRDRERSAYIDALEAADEGELGDLVKYFSGLQKDEFVRALSIASDVLKSTRAEEAIRAVQRALQRRRDSLTEEWESARSTADALVSVTEERLQEVATAMKSAMEDLFENPDFSVHSARQGDGRDQYRFQIVETAKQLGYFANTHTYRSWTRLVMKNANQSELLISFHGIGHEFQGVIASSACWFQRVDTEDGEREIRGVKPVADRVFQINYKESVDQTKERFLPWLEQSIVRAIELWQTTAL